MGCRIGDDVAMEAEAGVMCSEDGRKGHKPKSTGSF